MMPGSSGAGIRTRRWPRPSWVLLGLSTLAACGSPSVSTTDTAPAFDGGPEAAGATDAADAADAVAPDAVFDLAVPEGGTPVDAPTDQAAPRMPYRALAVASGSYHACALLDNHSVKCWGQNTYGQLGQGDTMTRGTKAAEMGDALPAIDLGTGRTAKSIAAGRYTTCAILDDDTVKCWGYGGQVGVPADTTAHASRGDEPGEMGDALPTVDLGPGRKATRIAVGYFNTCALLDDDRVSCWTNLAPVNQPVTAGRRVVELVGARRVCALLDDGSVDALAETPTLTPPLANGGRLRTIGGSDHGLCGVLVDGGITCNASLGIGRLVPTVDARPVALSLTVRAGVLCGLRGDGGVSCWVGPTFPWGEPFTDVADDGGRLVLLGQKAVALANGGLGHTCALLADGGVKCWTIGAEGTLAILGAAVRDGPFPESWHTIDLGTHPAP